MHFLSPADEQILSLQHSTTMFKSLCSKVVAVLNEDLPLRQDDLRYCKLICKTNPSILSNVSLSPFYITKILCYFTSVGY